MGDYFERIDKLVDRSKALSNAVARSDMLTMCNTSYDIATELSRELVECRRRGKLNAHSQTLMTRLDESIDNVEKMLTYATLRYSKRG
jgi:uncharacterized protein (UPF0262 family)